MYINRPTIRNAALVRKLRLAMICYKCSKLQQNRLSAFTNCQLPGATNSTPYQALPVVVRNKLKIYQWKADGVSPKFVELFSRLINSDVDIWGVQVLKLRKADKTPYIES